MAKNDKPVDQNKSTSALDNIAKKILSSVDSSYTERTILSAKDMQVQNIINKEMDLAKGVSSGAIVDFIASIKNNDPANKKTNPEVDADSIFTKNIGDIFGYFQDVYKNRFIEITDLKFISKFIPAIGEAVKTTLDSIISSDDISSTISRTIILSTSLSEAEKQSVMNEIKKLEIMNKIPKKLKNVVYKKALVTGNFYVYAISYKELFEEYSKIKASGKLQKFMGPSIVNSNNKAGFNLRANESATYADDSIIVVNVKDSAEAALESYLTGVKADKKDINELKMQLDSNFPTITIDNSSIMYEAMESMYAKETYTKSFPGTEEYKETGYIPDATMSNGKAEKFNTMGTYIKYIDSKNIIPVVIFNEVVGYYHIHAENKKKKDSSGTNGVASMGSAMFSSVNLTEKKKEDAITTIVDTISEGIMRNFSSKFVENNNEHKKLIADCIIANGIVDNDYRIQFIPAQHVVPFVINEDENGMGESILSDALFPAKLLLSLIICKMLNYMNKSGNKTIAHVYKGPIDTNSSNQLQRVTRMLQETNVTFNDLLSTNMVFSKFTRDSNIQLPRAKNGEKLVEFETQEGQQIDLGTEFENKLEQMAILGTGVPTVIMEYLNSADFAKQITSANIKFAGRISSLQADLEEPTTDFYKILLANSSLSDDIKTKILPTFAYKLPRPKVLTNSNNSDFIQTLLGSAQTLTEIYLGQNTANDDKDYPLVKDQLIKEMVMQNAPFLDWANIADMYEKAKINVSTIKAHKEAEAEILKNKEAKASAASGGGSSEFGDDL